MGRYLELASAALNDRWARRAAALIGRIDDVARRAGLREVFEERAAILEFEAGHTREAAERLAYEQLAAAILPRSSG